MENVADLSPMPQELFDQAGFSQKLEATLSILPQSQKLTVSLHLQHDLTFQEIAELLNQPLNTIKSRYRRALLDIKNKLHQNPSNFV